MKFSELVRILEADGFVLVKEKGSIRYYRKTGRDRLVRVDYHGSKEVPPEPVMPFSKPRALLRLTHSHSMLNLNYSLVIEATEDPDFFGFYSPELEGFSGIGHSVEDCLYKARFGMQEHATLLAELGMPVPRANSNPVVTIQNEQPVEA